MEVAPTATIIEAHLARVRNYHRVLLKGPEKAVKKQLESRKLKKKLLPKQSKSRNVPSRKSRAPAVSALSRLLPGKRGVKEREAKMLS